MKRSLLCAALLSPLVGADAPVPGIEELYRLDRLPLLKDAVAVGSFSSYDRTGGNNDGFSGKYSYLRREKDGLVIAELKGPGVIYRIATPTPTEDPIEFYFDGETKPRLRVPFVDLFTGKKEPFVRPLVGYGLGGFYCYLPLPFKKSCKILVRAPQVRFYQINYALYPPSAPIETFSPAPSESYLKRRKKARDLFAAYGSDISAYTAPPGSRIETRRFSAKLKPGEKAILFSVERGGRIVGLRLRPAASLAAKDRALTLRAFWDGEEKPAILCPAGDFFGYAWGRPAVRSLLLGTRGDTDYFYFPMPFDKSARVELLSERKSGPEVKVNGEVLFVPVPRRPGEGRFYALWRRENPTVKGKPFTFVDTKGRGHLVGCIQQSQGLETGNTYFFEGDDQTWIDGKLAIHGTGSEDFYNGGWYDVPGRWERRRSFPLTGCLGYYKHLGRTGGYRIMIGDVYSFRKSLRHTIEHAPTENSLLNDYCAVTFLYMASRPTCPFELPEVPDRAVSDPRRIVFAVWWNVPIYAFTFNNASLVRVGENIDGKDLRFLSLRAKGQDWFGRPFIAFSCDIPQTGVYRVSVEAASGPEQARVRLFRDEAPVGPEVDFYAEKRSLGPARFVGELKLEEGPNELLFKLTGKREAAEELRFDVRTIICERKK